MRRGSIVTYADDGRRHSAGMVTSEYRNSRQEFTVNDIDYDRGGGFFFTYRKIAFAFVFFLAITIAAAFIGVYIGSPPDKEVQDSFAILKKEEDVPEHYSLSPSIKPEVYRIELTPSSQVKQGVVEIEGRISIDFVRNGTDTGPHQLVLHSKRLTIKSYRLVVLEELRRKRDSNDDATTEHPSGSSNTTSQSDLATVEEPEFKTELKINANKTIETEGVYLLFLENPLENGKYSLEIEYEASVDDRVIFVKKYTKDNESRMLLASKLKPVNAPRLFPALNEAKLKASFVLTVSHPREAKVLSNTPLMNSSDSSENVTTDTFAETRRISAHDLGFVVGTGLESLGELDEARNLSYWSDGARKSQEFYLHDLIGPVVASYEDVFEGVARPTDKLDLVALPVNFDGLSVPGLIVLRESLFYTPTESPSFVKNAALLNLIGLVGEQWIGGLVDARNWTDAWYIEGSVIYFKYALLNKIDQSLEASDDFLIDVQMKVMENDAYLSSQSLDSTVGHHRIEAFDLSDNYEKGACLISMLHAALGDTAFRTGYVEFLRQWSYSIADSHEFLRILTGNATIDGEPSKRLDEAFVGWARQPGYPLINVTWHRENGTVVIRQGKFNFKESLEDKPSNELWWVPLTYVIEGDNWSEPAVFWLKGKEEITIHNISRSENDSWLVFNVNKTGYYRVNYDEATWYSIGRALLKDHNEIPTATRASLIDDALRLARQGSLSYGSALELLDYLGPSERDYGPWRALARHALQLNFALYETPAYPSFKEYMSTLVSGIYDENEKKIAEGSQLAMLAMQLACLFEHQRCTTWAKNKWENIFKTKDKTLVEEHARETVYCVGAQRGGQEELLYLMQKFEEETDREEKDRLLSALGCFQSPWILQKVLNEILEANKYEEGDIKVILRSYAKNPAAAQAARRFVQENWKEIVKRFSHSYWTMKAFVEASTSLLFTERDINEFNEFRDENVDSLKTMGHWITLNEMKAFSWIFRLNESTGSIQRWFKSRTNPPRRDSRV